MAKVALPVLLLLHVIIFGTTGESSGLEAACQRTTDAQFCMKLLQPYASQFEDNDPNKMGYSAITATLEQVQATRAFMIRESTNPETSDIQRAPIKDCLSRTSNSDDSLREAAKVFEEMKNINDEEERKKQKENILKKIDSSRNDQISCSNMLKEKNISGEIMDEVERQVDEAARAGLVAIAFIQ